MKIIPKEDCKVDTSIYINDDYPDGVFCQCGKTIHFKNRKPYENVIIVCPNCNSVIKYGGRY